MFHMYRPDLRFAGSIENPYDCAVMHQYTEAELPPEPWPLTHWPYYLDNRWELVEGYPK